MALQTVAERLRSTHHRGHQHHRLGGHVDTGVHTHEVVAQLASPLPEVAPHVVPEADELAAQPLHPLLLSIHARFHPVHARFHPVHARFHLVHARFHPVHPRFHPIHARFQPVHPRPQGLHRPQDLDAQVLAHHFRHWFFLLALPGLSRVLACPPTTGNERPREYARFYNLSSRVTGATSEERSPPWEKGF